MFRKLRTKVVVATAGLMVFAIAGTGVAMAQETPPADAPPEQASAHQLIIERAAEILEIDAESLGSAMQQAKQEVDRERLDAHGAERLAKAVENEALTQEGADEILAWWLARPEKATPQLVKMLAKHSDDTDAIFARLVESGKLTEDEATAIGARGRRWPGSPRPRARKARPWPERPTLEATGARPDTKKKPRGLESRGRFFVRI